MKNNQLPKPTESELEILQLLWEFGPSTVRFVNDKLNSLKETGYTTTLKLMQIMFDKGLVDRERSGKTHIYEALAKEEDTQIELLDRFVDKVFKGSATKLMLQALGRKKASPEELEQIRKLLDDMENN
ncbi:BlaI/MecI/CopY family transcriptional regulator [Flammeovirgaceae bacterium SG7u.111]|nr:BlaI/MecI/CopY family transcriptional regulator [Flammeovirgaceae bacterium SG7u.132]WPO33511.1 BlaI/MecI/CopY family transcriptional regulator [Flammeovirgaceae bacterium SG7u.111]